MLRAVQNPEDLEVRDGCIQRFEYTYTPSILILGVVAWRILAILITLQGNSGCSVLGA